MIELTKEQKNTFLELACRLSPENLSCDGELSNKEIDRKYKELMRQWRSMEREVGRKVDESEVWED